MAIYSAGQGLTDNRRSGVIIFAGLYFDYTCWGKNHDFAI